MALFRGFFVCVGSLGRTAPFGHLQLRPSCTVPTPSRVCVSHLLYLCSAAPFHPERPGFESQRQAGERRGFVHPNDPGLSPSGERCGFVHPNDPGLSPSTEREPAPSLKSEKKPPSKAREHNY